MRRIDLKRITNALETHQAAYLFLLWLGQHAHTRPELLSEQSQAALTDPTCCQAWVDTHIRDLPVAHRNFLSREGSAQMLASFFETSFHVKRLRWEGRLVEAELRKGPERPGARAQKRARHGGNPTAEALHRMCRDEGVRISPEAIRSLMKQPNLTHDLQVWCYGVALVRRSEGRGEGAADLVLWRSMAWQERKELNADVIWAARSRLLDVARAMGA